MLDVGKPCTQTSAGAPGVPQRLAKTLTSWPPFAGVDDRQGTAVPPSCQSAKMSIPSTYEMFRFFGAWYPTYSPAGHVDMRGKVMGGKHRARSSRTNVVIGSIAASVGVSSVLSAAIVELVAPEN